MPKFDSENATEKNGFRIVFGRLTMGRANLPPLALNVILEAWQE